MEIGAVEQQNEYRRSSKRRSAVFLCGLLAAEVFQFICWVDRSNLCGYVRTMPSNGPYITEQDVREHLDLDYVESHYDISYSPEDIAQAMRDAARQYNDIPPFVGEAMADKLDKSSGMFFDAIAASLYRRERARLTREDIDFVSGNVPANLVSKRIGHLNKLIEEHEARFVAAATTKKRTINLNAAFRQIG